MLRIERSQPSALLTELASARMDSQCTGVSIVLFSISTKGGIRTQHRAGHHRIPSGLVALVEALA
jgi:hypothetical protein